MGERWTSHPFPAASDHQFDTALAYDSARNVTVLFGGIGFDNAFNNETWELTGYCWSLLGHHRAQPRFLHAMAYDTAQAWWCSSAAMTGRLTVRPGQWDGQCVDASPVVRTEPAVRPRPGLRQCPQRHPALRWVPAAAKPGNGLGQCLDPQPTFVDGAQSAKPSCHGLRQRAAGDGAVRRGGSQRRHLGLESTGIRLQSEHDPGRTPVARGHGPPTCSGRTSCKRMGAASAVTPSLSTPQDR